MGGEKEWRQPKGRHKRSPARECWESGAFYLESLQGQHKTGHWNKSVPFCVVLRTHLDFQIRTQD